LEWIRQVFNSPEFGIAVLPASLLLGLISAVGSACNLAIIAAVAGYAGSRGDMHRRDAWIASGFFLLGTVLSLSILGWLIGFAVDITAVKSAFYGTIFVGFTAILFGIIALDLLPFRIPKIQIVNGRRLRGAIGAAFFGFAVGGGSIACTLACCGPLLPIILGLTALKGQGAWGALIMTMFAIGYSLPLAAAMLGIGFGMTTRIAKKVIVPIRFSAGIVLIGAGFWLLYGLRGSVNCG